MTHLLMIIIYLSFISLGLPDSMLGAAWPSMYTGLNAPVSYAGVISMMISFCTVFSSLFSYRLTARLGTGRVAALSTACAAMGLLGFSFSRRLWQLCLCTVPYGLGAGNVDAAINNYVATHCKSYHMSWLHCMWGLGATIGPAIMGAALTGGPGWNGGYRNVALLQLGFALILFAALRLWPKDEEKGEEQTRTLTFREVLAIPGVKAGALCFFCYCALETTAGLWAASYLTLNRGVPAEVAAGFAAMFYIGITAGRGASGFISMKLTDGQMVRLGFCVILAGIAAMALPFGRAAALAGFLLTGLGCAPIYPSLMHAIPCQFGRERSHAVIGIMTSGAYVGCCFVPLLFGTAAERVGMWLLPLFLLMLLTVMVLMRRRAERA